MLIGFLQLGQVFILQHLPAYAKTHKALGLQRGKIAGEFAFFLAGDGRQQHQLGAIGQGHHAIDHLADGLRRQRQAVRGAKRRARTGKQQAQVVVYLGHCAHGRARVVAGGFLLNRNGGRQAFNHIHIGLAHEL